MSKEEDAQEMEELQARIRAAFWQGVGEAIAQRMRGRQDEGSWGMLPMVTQPPSLPDAGVFQPDEVGRRELVENIAKSLGVPPRIFIGGPTY